MFLRITKNLGLSPSILHNIVKRFRESGEISVCKGQERTPLLNACDNHALNCHATMMDIATWAQEYFGKSMSLNTVCRCIKECNLKLYYAKRKAFINFAQKCRRVLWARSHLRWIERQWKCVLWSDNPHFSLFLGKTDIGFYVPKLKKTIQTVKNGKCKNQPPWWYGGASVPTSWVICLYVKVPLMRRLMLAFWRDICCCQHNNFYQKLWPCSFLVYIILQLLSSPWLPLSDSLLHDVP